LIINKKGEVLYAITLRNSFNEINRAKIHEKVKKLQWIPYLNPGLATTVITFKNKRHGLGLSARDLKPLNEREKIKYKKLIPSSVQSQ
jgi:hypothetical protein